MTALLELVGFACITVAVWAVDWKLGLAVGGILCVLTASYPPRLRRKGDGSP